MSLKEKLGLLSATILTVGFGAAAPADAQTTTTTRTTTQAQATAPAADEDEAIVVTGSILRNANSVSPLGVVTADDIQQRGQTTITDVIQNLSGNNQGALPNSFSANGAFAAGASGASLRGLTTNSTLVLIDGLRPAYYPLADDGSRNFVDLNTIPESIVDRVEVLKDGASSTYGADAIGGVINVITKRNFQGATFNLETGFGSDTGGGAGEWHASGMIGHGDLDRDGFNFYIAGEYQKDNILFSHDRGFPFNTNNFSSLCATSILPGGATTCRTNGIQNGVQFNNTFVGIGTDIVATVRSGGPANAAATGDYRLITGGCGVLTPVTITPAQATVSGFSAPVNLCQQDSRALFSVIAPADERASVSTRLTMKLGAHAEFYMAGTYYQNDVSYPGTPSAIRAVTTPAATGVTVSSANIALPPFVCPTGSLTVTCTAASPGATLNPNNPFAAAGNFARIFYSFGDIKRFNEEFSQTFRGAGGVHGDFDLSGRNWRYGVDVSVMQTNLKVTQLGYLYYPNLVTAVNTGAYNFAHPELNTQATRDFISPANYQYSSSKMIEGVANISTDLFDLPGGAAQLGVSVEARYEALSNPSANDDSKGAANRYFTINPFGAVGSRNVESASFEVDLPFTSQIDVNVSGREDHYSTGQSHFSPKIGARYTPFDMLTLRTTYSQGFRIPSFAESFAVPNTGFITVTPPAAWCIANHGGVASAYCASYGLGLTQVSSTTLKPETSENWNAGFVLRPLHNWSVSADYYRIQKNDVIAGGDFSPAVTAYYTGAPIPAGLTVIPDVADPAFPAAPPRIAYVRYGLENLNQQLTDGYDINVTGQMDLGGIEWSTSAELTYILRLNQTFPDGSTQHYAGSIGPYVITAASGTPKLRMNWQNTLTMGPASLSATVYYTDGYLETAEDNGGLYNDKTCLSGVGSGTPATYRDGATPIVCRVDSQTYVDLHGSYDIREGIEIYFDVKNLLGQDPSYDPTTYGASNYNPAWGTPGIIGRFFKIGARATF